MPLKSENKRIRLKPGWLFCILMTLCLLGISLFGYLSKRHTQNELKKRLETIKAQGYPTAFEDLNDYYPAVKDDENAALLITGLKAKIIEIDLMDRWLGAGSNSIMNATNPFTPEAKQALSGIINSNKTALKLIYEAMDRPRSRYPIHFIKGNSSHFNQFMDIKSAASLLRLEAHHHLAENRKTEALHSVQTSILVANTLKDEPMAISFLVRKACLGISISTLENLLHRSELPPDDLAQIQSELQTVEQKTDFARIVRGERAYNLGTWDDHPSINISPFSTPFDNWPDFLKKSGWMIYNHGGYREADMLNFLMMCDEVEKTSQSPVSEMTAQLEHLKDTWKEGAKITLDRTQTAQASSIWLSILGKQIELIAQLRVAQTALAVERFRMEKGHLPERLEEIAPTYIPTLPQDPYSGKSLQYKLTTGGFRVYSIGANKMDENGLKKRETSDTNPSDDISFNIERDVNR